MSPNVAREQDRYEALMKKSPEYYRWIALGHDVSSNVIESPCTKCGGKAVCAYAKLGVIVF